MTRQRSVEDYIKFLEEYWEIFPPTPPVPMSNTTLIPVDTGDLIERDEVLRAANDINKRYKKTMTKLAE